MVINNPREAQEKLEILGLEAFILLGELSTVHEVVRFVNKMEQAINSFKASQQNKSFSR